MNNKIILSNTCSGWNVIRKNNMFPYNNPFIGSLIVNDEQYIHFINNIENYLDSIPKLGEPSDNNLFYQQNGNKFYQHKDVKTPYPVIYLNDLEIHYIHENNFQECLDKVKERYSRMIQLIKSNNFQIYALFSFSEFINSFDNYHILVEKFLNQKIINNKNIYKIFIGPKKYCTLPNSFEIPEWNNIDLVRDNSHVFKFNNIEFNGQSFHKILHKHYFNLLG
jgi:uncharacterized protein (DUF1919 family)